MSRNDSGIAVEIHTGRNTGAAALQSLGAAASVPARFAGRVRFAIDVDDAVDALEMALRRAARPECFTEDAVQQLCRARGVTDCRMEWAILREGFHVVSRELLVERLVTAARRRLAGSMDEEVEVDALATTGPRGRGGTLVDTYRGTVSVEGDGLAVRCSLGSSIASPLTIALAGADGQARSARPPMPAGRWDVPAGHWDLPIGGSLAIEGSFAPRQRGQAPIQVRVHRRVHHREAGVSCSGPWSPLASPLEEIVGYIGTTALSRLAEVLPRHLAALAQADRGPTFIRVERLLRLGRMSQKSRVYQLYWQRLRDFLLWRVSTGAR